MKNDAHMNFMKRIGVTFADPAILTLAFTHRSFINEARASAKGNGKKAEHNERLEFLGDAVLELSVTDYLFRTYADKDEGDLTSYRAALVNAVTLAAAAEELGMNDCLLLSKGEARDTGRARQTILANTFEAVVGAIYLDQGYGAANGFIAAHLLPRAKALIESGAWRDAKSRFQEHAQAVYGLTPSYETISAEGPDHDKRFIVTVSVGEVKLGEGSGKSKQEAEQEAAKQALEEAEKAG